MLVPPCNWFIYDMGKRGCGISPMYQSINCPGGRTPAGREPKNPLPAGSPCGSPESQCPLSGLLFCIIVEASAGLLSETAAAHHFLKEWMRTVLGIASLALEYLHDRQDNVQANQIAER